MANKLKANCEAQVSAVIGRPLTEKESEDIVTSMKYFYRKHQQSDPSKTKQQLITMAAQNYAQQLEANATRRNVNAKLQAMAVFNNRLTYSEYRKAGMTPNQSARRILDRVDKIRIGVENQYKAQLVDMLERTAPRLLGLMENKNMIRDVIYEVSGKDTGNQEAKIAAQAWTKTIEDMRQRFNRAGGDIGQLEDYLFPQTHDRLKIIQAAKRLGASRFAKHDYTASQNAWVDYVLERLDKSKYLNDEMKPMTDDELRDMLSTAYRSITEDGANKLNLLEVTGGRGTSKANAHSQHRALHFKDADARLEYHERFGSNPSVLGTMMSHIGNMARDITLVEEMGPSPTSTFNTVKRMAQVENDRGSPKEGKVIQTQNTFLDMMFKNLTGTANIVESARLSVFAQGVRNLQVAGKLGMAYWTSLSDVSTYFHTSGINKLGYARAASLLLKSLNPLDKADKRLAERAGIIGDMLNSSAARFVDDNMGYGITGKLADLTMRVTFLTQWTDSIRRAQALNSMAGFAEARGQSWSDIDGWLRTRLENFGIDERAWNVIRLAQPEQIKSAEFLTVNGIKNISDADKAKYKISAKELDTVAGKYLGFIMDDAFMASLQPDLMTRSASNLGLAKGTLAGELWRCFWLFKSFPCAMLTRHWQRSGDLFRYKQNEKGTVSALASVSGYVASLIIGTTLIAYIGNIFKDLLSGSDVKNPFTKEAFTRAFTAGGGAGFLGDILVSAMDDYKYGHPSVFNFFGPVFSTALDAFTIFDKLKSDKDIGSNVLRIAKGNLPLVNVWYVKNLINHLVFNQIQEMLNPGYHDRIERKMQRNQGVGYWWKPTDIKPYRAPEIGSIVESK